MELFSHFLNYFRPVPADYNPVRSPEICSLSENLVLAPRLPVRVLKHELPVRFCCTGVRSEEHTSELQSHHDLVCRLLLEKKNDASMVLHGLLPKATIWRTRFVHAYLA